MIRFVGFSQCAQAVPEPEKKVKVRALGFNVKKDPGLVQTTLIDFLQ